MSGKKKEDAIRQQNWSRVINQIARYFDISLDERGIEYLDNQLQIAWCQGKSAGFADARKELNKLNKEIQNIEVHKALTEPWDKF